MISSVAFQMDPIETIDPAKDSSFALALAAQARGFRLYHYLPQDLSLCQGKLTARARAMTVARGAGCHFTAGAFETLDLAHCDIVWLRQDPPFDMAYITTTHLLDHIHPRTLVVNDPAAVRNAPEKLLVTHFADLMPPTLVTASLEVIRDFRARHGDIIIKPLYGNGGAGVFHLAPGDDNLGALLEMFRLTVGREPLMVQRYLPEVRAGDKRIILVEGEPVGAVLRVPAPGEARANMHAGGRPEKTSLTAREREICQRIGPVLRQRGLVFAGIDVIGDYLTEINVTSPTGLQEIDQLDGIDSAALIWEAIERRWAASRCN